MKEVLEMSFRITIQVRKIHEDCIRYSDPCRAHEYELREIEINKLSEQRDSFPKVQKINKQIEKNKKTNGSF
jgi:hypothetical protein